MSWDVVVLNYQGSAPADIEEMAEAGEPDLLGAAADVRAAISKHLEGVDWSDPTYGIYECVEFSIEFPIRDQDPVESLMLHVRGGGNPIAALLSFSEPNNWSLLDCSTSEIIDPENPSEEGWEGFQELRDGMLEDFEADADD